VDLANVKALADLMRLHKPCVVLTGAGTSTESGLPDFRSPGSGVYSRLDPIESLSVEALRERPAHFWKCFADLFTLSPDLQPNRGHVALAELEREGYVSAVITQNIDGLHARAGSENVIEVHGGLRNCHCVACGRTYPLQTALSRLDEVDVPTCAVCAGLLRPDVVLFGDEMPDCYLDAAEAAASARLILVVGSSLTVSPANALAFAARRLAIINREPTLADAKASVIIRMEAGEALTALARQLLGEIQL